ncbi:MAG: hypothetical protein Q9213_000725 [Squamulea squamosa]
MTSEIVVGIDFGTTNVEAVLSSKELLGWLHKTVEEVTADYFRLLWQYIQDDIQRVKGDKWRSIYSLKVILTVPAIWSATAKEKTLNAADSASLSENLTLVTEPEAAALAVLKDRNDEDEPLQAGRGNHTLHRSKLTIAASQETRLQFAMLEGEQLTSSAIKSRVLILYSWKNAQLATYVTTIVGKDQYSEIRPKSRKKMLREFEMSVKRCYTGDDREYSVDLQGVEDNPEQGIDDDTIKLKPYEIHPG